MKLEHAKLTEKRVKNFFEKSDYFGAIRADLRTTQIFVLKRILTPWLAILCSEFKWMRNRYGAMIFQRYCCIYELYKRRNYSWTKWEIITFWTRTMYILWSEAVSDEFTALVNKCLSGWSMRRSFEIQFHDISLVYIRSLKYSLTKMTLRYAIFKIRQIYRVSWGSLHEFETRILTVLDINTIWSTDIKPTFANISSKMRLFKQWKFP